MAMTLEVPISAEDVQVTGDHQSVALRVEKFGALVEYVEHLEGTLKSVDFDLQQEKLVTGFLLDALASSLSAMGEGGYAGTRRRRDLAARYLRETAHLYREGLIRRESAEAVRRKLSALAEGEAHAEFGQG